MMKIPAFQVIVALIFTAATLSLISSNVVGIQSKFVKANCIVHDPTTVQNVSCWVRSLNRTYSVANLRAFLIRRVDKVFLNFQVHKRTQVKYMPFLVNVTEDYCAFFARNQASQYLRILWSIIMPYTNMNHTCPYFGEALVKNLPLDSTRFPTLWPYGEYRIDVLVIGDGRDIITLQLSLEVAEGTPMWHH